MERTDSSVLELRLRLYRPDPPIDAVEAYLAALRDLTPTEPEERAHVLPARHHRLGPAGVSVALLAVAAAGVGMAWQATAATARPASTAPASHLEIPSVPGYRIGELFGGGATTALLDAEGVHAVVSVLCSGDGTLQIRLGQEPPTVLSCMQGGPALAMLESTQALDRFTLSVAPQPQVRWSLAVGAMAVPAS